MPVRDLIENRIQNFLGYGNLNAKVWFIGMEEGFNGTPEDLEVRFICTKDKSIIDIHVGMEDVPDHARWFSQHPNIQPTWGKLILILLTLDSESTDNENIREFQRLKFGRLGSNHCSLEFMPLPSPSIGPGDWIYSNYGINYLDSRHSYLEEILPKRIALFQELIRKHSPRNVIFYSFTYLSQWTEITGCDFKQQGSIYICKVKGTNFFVIPHPTARGITRDDWNKTAKEIKTLVGGV